MGAHRIYGIYVYEYIFTIMLSFTLQHSTEYETEQVIINKTNYFFEFYKKKKFCIMVMIRISILQMGSFWLIALVSTTLKVYTYHLKMNMVRQGREQHDVH